MSLRIIKVKTMWSNGEYETTYRVQRTLFGIPLWNMFPEFKDEKRAQEYLSSKCRNQIIEEVD